MIEQQIRGYTVTTKTLIPGVLHVVDVFWTADPGAGEGPSRFWSFGSTRRAQSRGRYEADLRANLDEEEALGIHADCLPEALATDAECTECRASKGELCKSYCSTWTHILHACGTVVMPNSPAIDALFEDRGAGS